MIDKSEIKNVPALPGVYLWKDKDGNVIYVGKAKNLQVRMSQYFDKNMLNSYKTPKMLEKIGSFSTFIVTSDREAFILERKLIDQYRPFYNVLFPIRSSFPYIRVKLENNGFKIDIQNHYKKEKNSIYYGPLPSNKNFKPLIRYLNHLLLAKDGLLIKNASQEYWKTKFEEAKKIMKFGPEFRNNLKQKIKETNEVFQFEVSSFYSSILDLLDYNKQEQQTFIKSQKSIDVFGFYESQEIMLIFVNFYRSGTLINQQEFALDIKTSKENFINEFLNEFYSKNPLPDEVVLDDKFASFNFDVKEIMVFAKTKMYLSLIDLANKNAQNDQQRKLENFLSQKNKAYKTHLKLGDYLEKTCRRIILFDNSFSKGTDVAIGVGVCFENGEANKNLYRYFNLFIDNFRHADVEYMRQTSLNYLKEWSEGVDVILADGDIAQIKAIRKSQNALNLNIPIFGLVKNDKHETRTLINEEGKEIVVNDLDVFHYLSRMQQEVDRFAKWAYHRKNTKNMLNSKLLKIKGLGPHTLTKLIEHFGSYTKIRNASLEELEKIVKKEIALAIKEQLN
ncbi:excinuclease ABC subunit C [Metamycoplasma arthritidis]|uniref:Excinuclease ABC nuclease subunit C n=1 Tax=Metamycoplasma arthritidis (strain 158L3-1) TaxID=243272 RepID=B3PN41_META1|nr:GIY-YIG nuclease family protein [Metamycoplasma arthritidis]ACF07443.1 excinuclease ABC nuclease subunit C [Metamycoplasma arthritidis 158L3-1]VEU78964.1 excinuclease ABC subunit C [Metamycoplasma arthritidis]